MTPLRAPDDLGSDLEDSCREAFCTSLPLTGSVAHAESVVMEAIEFWSPSDTVSQFIREELRPLLLMPDRHRHCFMLRMLVNLSRQACARILGLTGLQVDRYTTAAVSDLAQLNEQERSQ